MRKFSVLEQVLGAAHLAWDGTFVANQGVILALGNALDIGSCASILRCPSRLMD